jgi:mRNA-degrading endonuclease RelE of RelBE toxin-antitoxin system
LNCLPALRNSIKGWSGNTLRTDFQQLINQLKENPVSGQFIVHQCYKIRLDITSKGKGKRGGARVITHIRIEIERAFLLAIYDKSEQENLPASALLELLAGLQ